MGRMPKYIFAKHKGELYVKAKYSGIHPLIWFTDGLALCGFKGDKNTYLKVTEVLDWFKKEKEHGESHGYGRKELDRYSKFIDAYEKALREARSLTSLGEKT